MEEPTFTTTLATACFLLGPAFLCGFVCSLIKRGCFLLGFLLGPAGIAFAVLARAIAPRSAGRQTAARGRCYDSRLRIRNPRKLVIRRK